MAGSSKEEDREMVSAFQAGSRAAFDRLVLKHKDRLVNLCYWFLGDYDEASDAAQETFIKVYRSLKGFRFESAFSTWLYRIAVNTCRNRVKSAEYRRRGETVSLDNPGAQGKADPPLEIRDESRSPRAELEKKERLRLIKKAIDSLPAEQKAVVTLRDIEGLCYDEIATITGFSLGTVKSRLARARLDLRKKLKGVV
ncbi:MAG: sigma-70 family RNA polymerase sigma factor [Deltaproteobacteria bacterium]|nr:sigma-70 family RNA polymerase sigma factor [Deltaproteobacteria bacterium]